jgi:hypothetical protein
LNLKRPFISIKHAQWLHRKNLINKKRFFLPQRTFLVSCFTICRSLASWMSLAGVFTSELPIFFHSFFRISCVCDFWLGKLIRQAHLFSTLSALFVNSMLIILVLCCLFFSVPPSPWSPENLRFFSSSFSEKLCCECCEGRRTLFMLINLKFFCPFLCVCCFSVFWKKMV